jgi:glycosyltransferase involved in cell wall biosynthesis
LYFGSLIRKKGLLELPLIFNAVVAKNPAAKLVLVGRDVPDIISGNASTWQMMQELFSEEALQRLHYIGVVPYEEVRHYISSATVSVFPTFAEALPVSWIEAMAMQQPIVASNIGWAKEVIDEDENGFLVPPTSHEEYATKINTLLESKELQAQFGIAAREKVVEKFSIVTIAKQSSLFYRFVIESKQNQL